ncbi:hypothetical protein MTY_0211 [Moorella thermoacetica Y72]|uniref:Uncharacterized protein n=1 Tax=Moorella thermoacetica Y72 TaxID=1325331 RepID=A0A0S6UAQ3_NEOTH|nr:hypothetical protein MTY_0211 [Moorella thermoacetica Y72]
MPPFFTSSPFPIPPDAIPVQGMVSLLMSIVP